jgi:hypothetical protein
MYLSFSKSLGGRTFLNDLLAPLRFHIMKPPVRGFGKHLEIFPAFFFRKILGP